MISALVESVFVEAAQVLKPPPALTVSEWAERERVLSTETSAAAGRYRVANAPYQRGMQDAILEPLVEEVVLFTSAQIGKSTCLENIFGYFVTEDPCSIIWMWQTLDRAKEWSGQDLAFMLRDTPALSALLEAGAKKTQNRLLYKSFPGGSLNVIGANSAGALRAKRARIVIGDEVDAYPASAGPEGDPIKLVAKRQLTFWNRKRVLSSTGTIRGASRIEAAYGETDQRKYYVPCPHCTQAAGKPDGFQILKWKRLVYPAAEAPTQQNVVYPCEHCAVALTELDKAWMLEHGEWRAERPEITGKAGFWLNEMYSPFTTWAQMVEQWKEALAHRENPELLKTFINLSLGETWEDKGEAVEAHDLMKRAAQEVYPPPEAPDGVVVVTAGIDVQQDRLELVASGWGKGEECWDLDWRRFDGDTSRPEVWQQLDEYLLGRRFLHARGVWLEIVAAMVDSGFRAHEVYAWSKPRGARWIFAAKGIAGFGKPALGRATTNNRAKVKLYPVGVDVVKETLYARLRIQEAGAGYQHFPRQWPDRTADPNEYFRQLTSEQLKRRYLRGFPVRYWEKLPGARNEVLDCKVYAYAALLSLSQEPRRKLEQMRKDLLERAKYLVQARRAKVSPDQLGLLEPPAAAPTALLQTSAEQAEAEEAGFGAQEYKLAEQVDAAPEAAPPTPTPKVKVRKSWI